MNSRKIVGRALRHLLKLVVMMGALIGVMYATKTLAVSPAEILGAKGGILIVAMVAISVAFPFYGFSSARVYASMKEHRAEIFQAMEMSGYQQVGETEEGAQIYRAKSLWKRLVNVGDDVLTLTPVGADAVEISGLRKEVEAVRFRITGLVNGTK